MDGKEIADLKVAIQKLLETREDLKRKLIDVEKAIEELRHELRVTR